jgi:queuine tRNA-ribosyltransferase
VVLRYQVLAHCAETGARAGLIETLHGPMTTPTFMPVGTQATVKGLLPNDLRAIGAHCVLANTYHLWLRPGHELVAEAGGLHQFMAWERPILTDSGGFQVMSLAHLRELDEQGVRFRSHLDGSPRELTPELAMEIQAALDSDIAMVLDECPPYPCEPQRLAESTDRTTRWAERSLAATHAPGQSVFVIAQGGMDLDLRARSAQQLAQLRADGFAIGGISVGEARSESWPALEVSIANLPDDRPRYLMGVGTPSDLIEGIARGIDMFDCVLPTRLGRNGAVFTPEGRLNLRNAALAGRPEPIDSNCDCDACSRFSRGYLHHLVRSGEDLGLRLASMHNLRFLLRLAEQARLAILEGRFPAFYRETPREPVPATPGPPRASRSSHRP